MQREKIGEDNEDNMERDEPSDSRSRAFRMIEERMQKRRQRASLGRLISYIIALIFVIFLMLWLRRAAM